MAYVRQTLRENDLAYLDTMGGPVACRVLRIYHGPGPNCGPGIYRPSSDIQCDVLITTTSKGMTYHRGEIVRGNWALKVVPRKSIRMSRGSILPYDVEVPRVILP